MTKKEILDYVMENPGNTNVSVLGPMVDAVAGVIPTGKITITENGNDIDVAQYAEADVAVPNPNTVVTVTGTMANPWGDLDVAELTAAIKEDRATAYVNFVFLGNTYNKVYIRIAPGDRLMISLFSSAGTVKNCNGFIIEYDDEGAVYLAYLLAGGNVSDLSSQTSAVITELVVLYHPMPEE